MGLQFLHGELKTPGEHCSGDICVLYACVRLRLMFSGKCLHLVCKDLCLKRAYIHLKIIIVERFPFVEAVKFIIALA